MTAGLDLGDKYSYLCLIDTQNGEVVEEGRLRTTPEDPRRRFASEPSLCIAIETGSHSPWVSRVLEECSHEFGGQCQEGVRLITRTSARQTRSTPRTAGPRGPPRSEAALSGQAQGRRLPGAHGLNPLRVRRWSGAARSWSTTFEGRSSPSVIACPSALPGLPQAGLTAHPRGPPAGPRTRLGADRFAYRAHPRLITGVWWRLPGALPGNRAVASGRGGRAAHGAHLRAYPEDPTASRRVARWEAYPGAGTRHRPIGGAPSPDAHLQGGRRRCSRNARGRKRRLHPWPLRLGLSDLRRHGEKIASRGARTPRNGRRWPQRGSRGALHRLG